MKNSLIQMFYAMSNTQFFQLIDIWHLAAHRFKDVSTAQIGPAWLQVNVIKLMCDVFSQLLLSVIKQVVY